MDLPPGTLVDRALLLGTAALPEREARSPLDLGRALGAGFFSEAGCSMGLAATGAASSHLEQADPSRAREQADPGRAREQVEAAVQPARVVPLLTRGARVPVRIYRYEPGQHFGLHQDQSYFGEDGTKSLLTFMVYLNDGFGGGETDFPEQERTIVPEAGTALLFQHMLLHAGKRVTSGTKL